MAASKPLSRAQEHAAEGFRPPQAGRATAEVNRHQAFAVEERTLGGFFRTPAMSAVRQSPPALTRSVPPPWHSRAQLGQHGVRVFVVWNRRPYRHGKLAVRAARAAEGKVHVHAKRTRIVAGATGWIQNGLGGIASLQTREG